MSETKIGGGQLRGPRGHRGPTGPTGPGSAVVGPTGSAGATGPTGATGFPPVIAAATVNGGTSLFTRQSGFTGTGPTHPGTGQYVLTLANPPADSTFLVVAPSIVGAGGGTGEITWEPSGSNILIFTFSGTGVATDQNFGIVVYNLTP